MKGIIPNLIAVVLPLDDPPQWETFYENMKKLNNYIQHFNVILCILSTSLFLIVGCASPKTATNPLEGWQSDFKNQPGQTILNDYQDYIQKLPPKEREHVDKYSIWFYEDGKGGHAIMIQIPLNGVWWEHVLIYDQNDVRTKTVKRATGKYRC